MKRWLRLGVRGLIGLDRGRGYEILRRLPRRELIKVAAGAVGVAGVLVATLRYLGSSPWSYYIVVTLGLFVYITLTTARIDDRQSSD